MNKLWSLLLLVVFCIREIVITNIKLMIVCFSPRIVHKPGFVKVKISESLNETQQVLLSHLITITPGTMTVDLQNNDTLMVHMLDLNVDEHESLISSVSKIETLLINIFGGKK